MSGGHGRAAVELCVAKPLESCPRENVLLTRWAFSTLADSYSSFCLQPPGDTIPRAGIVDALSVGCVPVLFHPAQQKLWPRHWNASQASLLFDWSGTRGNASQVLQDLMALSPERVQQLRRAATAAAQTMYYRGELGDPNRKDAVDLLVRTLTSPSTWPRMSAERGSARRPKKL